MSIAWHTLGILLILISCHSKKYESNDLPILGDRLVSYLDRNGTLQDSVHKHIIPDFNFTDQYGHDFSLATLSNNISVVEFFFTSCPSICPKVAVQMQKIHANFKDHEKFNLVSITLDGKRDTPQKLYQYAEKHESNHSNWYFLNAHSEEVMDLAWNGFFVPSTIDISSDIMHKGILILVDNQRQIRGMYDGISDDSSSKLIEDISLLIEQF